MPRYAGQMLPSGTAGTQGETWVPSDGSNVPAWQYGHYLAAAGWMVGMTGIYVTRVPNVAGWSVLLVDDPAGADLPPDTPTVLNPPTLPPSYLGVDAVGDQTAGVVPVAGDVTPGVPVQAAQVLGGVPGAFVNMTVAGNRWSGNITMVAGASTVQVRVAGQSFNSAQSAPFTVT